MKQGSSDLEAQEGQGPQHYFLENCRALIGNLMDKVDDAERIRREEHAVQMASLERLHYFQSQLQERLVMVWRGGICSRRKSKN